MSEIKVIDNFFDDPDSIREEALLAKYWDPKDHAESRAMHPGRRTLMLHRCAVKSYNELVNTTKKHFFDGWIYHDSSFQSNLESDTPNNWIHRDSISDCWGKPATHAIIVYLSKNPGKNSGTSFYKEEREDSLFYVVENMYNRAAMYSTEILHKGNIFFGDTLETSRLFIIDFIRGE